MNEHERLLAEIDELAEGYFRLRDERKRFGPKQLAELQRMLVVTLRRLGGSIELTEAEKSYLADQDGDFAFELICPFVDSYPSGRVYLRLKNESPRGLS